MAPSIMAAPPSSVQPGLQQRAAATQAGCRRHGSWLRVCSAPCRVDDKSSPQCPPGGGSTWKLLLLPGLAPQHRRQLRGSAWPGDGGVHRQAVVAGGEDTGDPFCAMDQG